MTSICDVVLYCLACSEVTGPGAIKKAAIVNTLAAVTVHSALLINNSN